MHFLIKPEPVVYIMLLDALKNSHSAVCNTKSLKLRSHEERGKLQYMRACPQNNVCAAK